MHSKVIIASLVCFLAASFGDNRIYNSVKETQQKDNEISVCDAPNEKHASVEVQNDRGDISAGGWFDIITGVEAKTPAWSTITERDDPYDLLEGYFSSFNQLGITINIPSSNGDYYIGFKINGNEVVKIFIFVKDGMATVSPLSKGDARAKYFMEYVATDKEKSFLAQRVTPNLSPRLLSINGTGSSKIEKGGLSSSLIGVHFPLIPGLPTPANYELTKFDAEKHYSEFVNGVADITTRVNYKDKKMTIFGQQDSGVDVNIHVSWLDENGDSHPLKGIRTEVLTPQNTTFLDNLDALVSSYHTNEEGIYRCHIGSKAAKYQVDQLQFRLSAINSAVIIDDDNGINYTYCYSIKGSAPSIYTRSLESYSEINYYVSIRSGSSDRANAYEISQAEMLPYKYAADFAGDIDIETCQLHYPAISTSFSNNRGEGKAVRVRYDDYKNWDVLNHEYGHYICDVLGLCSVPGMYKQHDSGEDLINRYGLTDGLELAFSEGLATYIGIASQRYKAEGLNIAGVGDLKYQDPLRNVFINYEESSAGLGWNITSGEGYECCITSVLLKILTSEETYVDDSLMWEALKTNEGEKWYVTGLLNRILDFCYGDYVEVCQIIRNEHFAREYLFNYDLAEWNIMLYMCGSDLEYNPGAPGTPSGSGYGEYLIKQGKPKTIPNYARLLGAISGNIDRILGIKNKPDNVNILIETGGAAVWDNDVVNDYTNGDRNKLNRFHVGKANNGFGKLVYDGCDYGNMGNTEPFERFLEWGIKNYPARRTGIIFVGHGDGINGVCPHEYTYYTVNYNQSDRVYNELDSYEVSSALDYVFGQYNLSKFEFVGYDACNMQIQDVAYYNEPYFKYMIASEESSASVVLNPDEQNQPQTGTSLIYDTWIDDLYCNPSITTSTLLNVIVDNYTHYGNCFEGKVKTLSVLDLTQMNKYYTNFENLALSIKDVVSNNYSTFLNLIMQSYHFAEGEMGIVDGYEVLKNLYNWNLLINYRSQIEEVIESYTSMVVNSSAVDQYGYSYNSYIHGLAFYIARKKNVVQMEYRNHLTEFYNWKSLVLDL